MKKILFIFLNFALIEIKTNDNLKLAWTTLHMHMAMQKEEKKPSDLKDSKEIEYNANKKRAARLPKENKNPHDKRHKKFKMP